jgi:hypothetical protein
MAAAYHCTGTTCPETLFSLVDFISHFKLLCRKQTRVFWREQKRRDGLAAD